MTDTKPKRRYHMPSAQLLHFAELLLARDPMDPEQSVVNCWVKAFVTGMGLPDRRLEDKKFRYKYAEAAKDRLASQRFVQCMEDLKEQRIKNAALVAQAVRAQEMSRAEQATVTEGKVLYEAACIAFADPANIYDETGSLLPKSQWPEIERRAISKIKKTTGRNRAGEITSETVEVSFWDKTQALDKLMKNMGMFLNDNKQKTDPMAGLSKDKRDQLLKMLAGERSDVVRTGTH